jgi:hypothetical protein
MWIGVADASTSSGIRRRVCAEKLIETKKVARALHLTTLVAAPEFLQLYHALSTHLGF